MNKERSNLIAEISRNPNNSEAIKRLSELREERVIELSESKNLTFDYRVKVRSYRNIISKN